VVLCEKEKLLLSGNRPDAIVFSLRNHLENARGIADTLFSITFDDPNFPVSEMKFRYNMALGSAEASGGNTGHLASNFYYRPERAPLEAEMTARARY
jgi:hypothetical protein